jgi:hypothetical protein
VISPSQVRYLQRTTQERNKRRNAIRTQDPSIRAGEDTSCLRPHGHRDGQPYNHPVILASYLSNLFLSCRVKSTEILQGLFSMHSPSGHTLPLLKVGMEAHCATTLLLRLPVQHWSWVSQTPCRLLHVYRCLLVWLTARPWGQREHDPPKRRYPTSTLQGVASQNIVLVLATIMCQDSTLGISPTYKPDDWDSIPDRCKRFSLFHSLLFNLYLGVHSYWLKQRGYEADHSPPNSAGSKDSEAHVFMSL